jgi:hypothetical protein
MAFEETCMRKPPSWVDPLMRIGYTARGVVYLLVGSLALVAALDGGRTPDSKSALASLLDEPFGKTLLALISIGLVAYAAWSCIEAALDLDNKGNNIKGSLSRIAEFISGMVYVALAAWVAALLVGKKSSGGDETDHWTAVLMQQPFGRWLVAAVGCIFIGICVKYFLNARHGEYRKSLRYTPLAARLDPLLKAGLVAHGLVIGIVGTFFIWAAWTANPSRAGGMGEALSTVRSADAGQGLLAVLAIGLLAFALFCFIVAAFRIVPRCAPKDLQTLASKARSLLHA